jgi:hypothetical protein
MEFVHQRPFPLYKLETWTSCFLKPLRMEAKDFGQRLDFVAGGAVGENSSTVHVGLILKKERAPAVNRGSGE